MLKWKVYFHFEQWKVDFSLSLISTSTYVAFSLTLILSLSRRKGWYPSWNIPMLLLILLWTNAASSSPASLTALPNLPLLRPSEKTSPLSLKKLNFTGFSPISVIYLWNAIITANVSTADNVLLTAPNMSPSAVPDGIDLPAPVTAAPTGPIADSTSISILRNKLIVITVPLCLTPGKE